MSRKTVLIGVAILLALALGLGATLFATDEASPPSVPRGPNVLLIVTDDQRRETLHGMPATARLFRKRGVEFPNAFATTPSCCPSRATIMTGRYAHNHGVKRFTPLELDQDTTLQRYLDDFGYRNLIVGKYLNAWPLRRDPPHFDEWAIFPQSTARTYEGKGRWNVDGRVEAPGAYSTDSFASMVTAFFDEGERDDARPWFAYVAVPAAHPPYVAEKRYARAQVGRWGENPAVDTGRRGKPPYLAERSEQRCDDRCGRNVRAAQYRTLYSVDDMVKELFDSMRALGETRDTLAIFVSDNGMHWGEFGVSGKRSPYRASVEVPLLVRWPAHLSAGVDPRLVSNVDIAPTILDAVGIDDAGDHLDGRSLLSSAWARDAILLEHWGSRARGHVPTWASLRTRRWQYIEYVERARRRDAWRELYDLKRDRWQLRNLFAAAKARQPSRRLVRRLEARLRRARRCAGATCP